MPDPNNPLTPEEAELLRHEMERTKELAEPIPGPATVTYFHAPPEQLIAGGLPMTISGGSVTANELSAESGWYTKGPVIGGFVEQPPPSTHELLEHHVGQILDLLGYDRHDQHFESTPHRVAEVLLEYQKNGDPTFVGELLERKFVEPGAVSSLVIEGPIRVISRCAHHLEPVDGWAWVGYIPNAHVCGLSKLARIVHHFAKQLTVQERITQQVADALEQHLKPLGVMVVIEAVHGCMKRRGVMEPIAGTTTSVVRGVFKESVSAKTEFMMLMRRPNL